MMLEKHIILIGFKHVGKSTLGKLLANALDVNFIDSDSMIESIYHDQEEVQLTCRQIMDKHGDVYFRRIETATLLRIIDLQPSVIALGGGTPIIFENQRHITPHTIIHLTANPTVVYNRIISHGMPSFFNVSLDPRQCFNDLWNSREEIYTSLANVSVDNTLAIESTLACLLESIAL